MKHQPFCPSPHEWLTHCHYCEVILKAYRSGWNDHARTVQHWQDTHGAYRQQPPAPACPWCAPGGES